MALLIGCGFVPSVLSRCETVGASAGAAYGGSRLTEKERILLLSNPSNSKNRSSGSSEKVSRTKNRKEVSNANMISRNGIKYQINNSATYGVYLKILNKALDQLDICIGKWRRVFVIRFDLHQRWHTANNSMVSKFRKNLVRRIERKYELFEVGFVWVREQERAKSQHYHMALFLDGDKINHSASIGKIIREAWVAVKAGNSVHIPKNCYYNVTDEDSKQEVIYRLSYLAKQRGKGYRPPQTKDYSVSRLCMPPRYDFNTGESC